MPLLQESTTQRDLLGREIKVEPQENTDLKNQLGSMQFPSFGNSAMFTPSQILMASQMLAATGLGIQPHPAFFHPALFAPWSANSPASPPSPPTSTEQTSPALKTRKNNNNNNVVTSSSVEGLGKRKISSKQLEEEPLASPTSSSSPPSESGSAKDSGRDKQFTCGVCNRSFGYKHVLQNHERTHTGEKPFECPQCHKRFTRDHHLKTHMRLHTGERPYHCEHCDRQFVQVANLRRHLRVHTGERPYACEHCNSRFSDSNQLKAHVLIHTNEKPFNCEKCHARFRRRHHLLHHKCGKEETILSSEDERMSTRLQPQEPHPIILNSLPLQISLPEQTEPEDLSMSTGLHSHSSGDSPSSRDDFEEDYEEHEDGLYFQRNSARMAKRTHS